MIISLMNIDLLVSNASNIYLKAASKTLFYKKSKEKQPMFQAGM